MWLYEYKWRYIFIGNWGTLSAYCTRQFYLPIQTLYEQTVLYFAYIVFFKFPTFSHVLFMYRNQLVSLITKAVKNGFGEILLFVYR